MREQLPVVALPGCGLIHDGTGDGCHRQQRHDDQRALHANILRPNRNFQGRSGSMLSNMAFVKQARVVDWSGVAGQEAALIQRCIGGDEAAFAELVGENQRMVVHLAFNLLGDRDEALDLSQEVFLRVFRTIGRFRGQSTLKTWIYRIAVNQARNRHRFWRRRHKADQVSLDAHVAKHGELLSNGESGPDRLLAQKELADRLKLALDGLPFDQRTAIVLREVDGLSYEEIAFSLGVAIGTVKSRLTRARQTLRLELREARGH